MSICFSHFISHTLKIQVLWEDMFLRKEVEARESCLLFYFNVAAQMTFYCCYMSCNYKRMECAVSWQYDFVQRVGFVGSWMKVQFGLVAGVLCHSVIIIMAIAIALPQIILPF